MSASLPSGYTELEYLGSNGTQWIDTGILGTAITGFKVKGFVLPNGSQNAQLIGGQGNSSSSLAFYGARDLSGNRAWYAMNAGSSLVPSTEWATSDITINSSTSQTGTIVNETTGVGYEVTSLATNSSWGFTDGNIFIFGGYSSRRSPDAKIAYLKLYTSNGLVFDGIPAKRNNDNVLGIYDLANSGKNLFDKDNATVLNGYISNLGIGNATRIVSGTTERTTYIKCEPNTTYTIQMSGNDYFRVASFPDEPTFSSSNIVNSVELFNQNGVTVATVTTNQYANYLAIEYTNSGGDTATTNVFKVLQVEEGATATAYEPYPFYTNAGTGDFIAGSEIFSTIKVATTAYVEESFKDSVDELNNTIGTIKNVVDNTIIQADRIGKLQTGKQTRPVENCPDGAQCLLITEADGSLHWYPICDENGNIGTQNN